MSANSTQEYVNISVNGSNENNTVFVHKEESNNEISSASKNLSDEFENKLAHEENLNNVLNSSSPIDKNDVESSMQKPINNDEHHAKYIEKFTANNLALNKENISISESDNIDKTSQDYSSPGKNKGKPNALLQQTIVNAVESVLPIDKSQVESEPNNSKPTDENKNFEENSLKSSPENVNISDRDDNKINDNEILDVKEEPLSHEDKDFVLVESKTDSQNPVYETNETNVAVPESIVENFDNTGNEQKKESVVASDVVVSQSRSDKIDEVLSKSLNDNNQNQQHENKIENLKTHINNDTINDIESFKAEPNESAINKTESESGKAHINDNDTSNPSQVTEIDLKSQSSMSNTFQNNENIETPNQENNDKQNQEHDIDNAVETKLLEKVQITKTVPEETKLEETREKNNKEFPVDDVEDNPFDENSKTLKEQSSNKENDKEPEWLDILGNGLLRKKVMKKGNEGTRPVAGDIVTISYEGKLDDGRIVDKTTSQSIILSDEDVIAALDLAVALMNNKEVAIVDTDARYAYGILGRHDYKPAIPPNAHIVYEVELVDVEPGKDMKDLTADEIVLYGDKKRIRGNDLYSRQDYAASINSYRRALRYLSQSSEKKVVEMKMKILNNLGASQLKVKAYSMAIMSLDEVLQHNQDNVKALYRKGKCLIGLGKDDEALTFMKKASTLDPQNKLVAQDLNLLKSRLSVTQQKEKVMYQRMFQNKSEQSKEQEVEEKSEGSYWPYVVGTSLLVASISLIGGMFWYKHR